MLSFFFIYGGFFSQVLNLKNSCQHTLERNLHTMKSVDKIFLDTDLQRHL